MLVSNAVFDVNIIVYIESVGRVPDNGVGFLYVEYFIVLHIEDYPPQNLISFPIIASI
jgi:hypothetical protein